MVADLMGITRQVAVEVVMFGEGVVNSSIQYQVFAPIWFVIGLYRGMINGGP